MKKIYNSTEERNKAKYLRFKQTDAYKNKIKRIGKQEKARRNEVCHLDWNWLKDQFECDINTGMMVYPKPYKANGFLVCRIWGKIYPVHRLIVMKALNQLLIFPAEKRLIIHTDGNKMNNRIFNLKFISRQEQSAIARNKRLKNLRESWKKV